MFGITYTVILLAIVGNGILSGLYFVLSNFAMRIFAAVISTALLAVSLLLVL